MKKTYTKKQIQEAISYWKKQLAEGNYRKVNEEAEVGNNMLAETDGNFTIGAVLKGNIVVDIYPNHFYNLKTVDQILHDSYAYECWFKYAESMYPSVMRLEVCDLSKPISGGRWFNDVKDKDLFDPDEKERKKAWDDVVKWMKSARGQRALDDDKAHEDEALDKGNYRKVNEKLDRDKYEKIKNKLLDELEAHGPVAMCKKLHWACREMKNTADHEQYETYVYVNKEEPPAAKDVVMKAINLHAWHDAGGGLDDMMTTVNVDDVQYKNGNLSFTGRNQNGKKSQYTFSRNDDGTWGGFYT